MDSKKWETISESERNAMMDECFAYDDVLLEKGYLVVGEALQSAQNAIHPEVEECQSVYHRWPICRDEGAVGRDPRARGQRPESRHPVDVETSGLKAGG